MPVGRKSKELYYVPRVSSRGGGLWKKRRGEPTVRGLHPPLAFGMPSWNPLMAASFSTLYWTLRAIIQSVVTRSTVRRCFRKNNSHSLLIAGAG